MRGLTNAEAEYLTDCAGPPPADEDIGAPWCGPSPQVVAVRGGLERRRLVALVTFTRIDGTWEADYDVITPLDRIALACHAASSISPDGLP